MGFRRRSDCLLHLLIFAYCVLVPDYFPFAYGQSNGTTVTPINRDLYHTRGALLEEIESLVDRHPDKFTIDKISSKNKGYEAQIRVVNYCRNQKHNDEGAKLRILFSFGQHARELITTELALRLLSILSEEEFLPNADRGTLNKTLDRVIIKVVPIENLNGRKLVEDGDLCERRNGRGVDLNRNWSVDWGKKEKDYDPYEENPGPAPFSEPESQIMRKLAVSFEPHIWVNVHSGMEALFMPYDHKNTTPVGMPSQIMKSMLHDLNHFYLKDHCLVGSGGGSVGYLAHGTATDYMYDVARVPMAFTFEIYGDPNASSKDCFKMFNPVDISSFNRVLNSWSAAFFHMFSVGVHHLDGLQSKAMASSFDNWVSIDDYLNGYLMQRKSRYGKKIEVLDLGLQEIRTYFRLFLLSSVLLLFMFCSRISKSTRPLVSAMTL
ncbi:metallocarboxypeptidase A-like protein MCYG_01475 [Andrographis paniculata]|uniref:metallocarboxypeptidase A-like protein MCYG_01475 n=1 Tax=Andrographis paniculata TaxID=175694 RepID=UPI0021E7AFFB|nr:metallocarboxypeptidase A-like protein MCYG_01475 [Andrographis paniculata]